MTVALSLIQLLGGSFRRHCSLNLEHTSDGTRLNGVQKEAGVNQRISLRRLHSRLRTDATTLLKPLVTQGFRPPNRSSAAIDSGHRTGTYSWHEQQK